MNNEKFAAILIVLPWVVACIALAVLYPLEFQVALFIFVLLLIK